MKKMIFAVAFLSLLLIGCMQNPYSTQVPTQERLSSISAANTTVPSSVSSAPTATAESNEFEESQDASDFPESVDTSNAENDTFGDNSSQTADNESFFGNATQTDHET